MEDKQTGVLIDPEFMAEIELIKKRNAQLESQNERLIEIICNLSTSLKNSLD